MKLHRLHKLCKCGQDDIQDDQLGLLYFAALSILMFTFIESGYFVFKANYISVIICYTECKDSHYLPTVNNQSHSNLNIEYSEKLQRENCIKNRYETSMETLERLKVNAAYTKYFMPIIAFLFLLTHFPSADEILTLKLSNPTNIDWEILCDLLCIFGTIFITTTFSFSKVRGVEHDGIYKATSCYNELILK